MYDGCVVTSKWNAGGAVIREKVFALSGFFALAARASPS